MHYSQDYYTQAKNRLEKLHQEIQERKASLSETETAREKEQTEKELERIMDRIHERETNIKRTVNPDKLAAFFHLMGKAIEAAQYCELNIDIKTSDSMYGVLKLQSGYLMLNKESDIHLREILNELVIRAEQYSIAALDGVFEMEYWFDLYDELEKKSSPPSC